MIMQGVSAEQAEKWITSPQNTIAQRVDKLKKTQYDQMSKSQVQEIAVNK
jgi:hypothetical protein